ncbi:MULTISPECIES: hypothetical protein [unclassified Mycoplasma]|uniref:hypothetical protein n=1 Tax=unclassified Mycoplasma TaxID=2683645 RepID=UPI001C0F69A6|nr:MULTISPECIES: hypothetical protein [unclassified Mycoplasma]MBU4693226.1 hypothetical protein [Mycoplasma sp. CSL7491-lung]MCU4706991.1 hypothetical protein [Mycoplasma sp. CSL7503-lung]
MFNILKYNYLDEKTFNTIVLNNWKSISKLKEFERYNSAKQFIALYFKRIDFFIKIFESISENKKEDKWWSYDDDLNNVGVDKFYCIEKPFDEELLPVLGVKEINSKQKEYPTDAFIPRTIRSIKRNKFIEIEKIEWENNKYI